MNGGLFQMDIPWAFAAADDRCDSSITAGVTTITGKARTGSIFPLPEPAREGPTRRLSGEQDY